jgi:anti-anti-sigma regulatory factor
MIGKRPEEDAAMQVQTERPLTVIHNGDLAIVRFGEPVLDESNVGPLGSELNRLAEAPGRRMHLDLDSVRMVSSTWMCRFVVLSKGLAASGGELVLFNAGPEVREEFAVVRLDRMLNVRR